MTSYTSKAFWEDAGERAVKTVAQSAVVTIGADAFDVLHADWVTFGSVSLGAGVLSILTSIASAKVGDDTPSLVKPPVPEPEPISSTHPIE